MKIAGVIPARYKSSRFEGKPLADICGKPMIWWVYNQAKKVKRFDEVYVATEDKRIVKSCEEFGINVLLTADTHQTGTDRLGEVAQRIAADFYVNIQGDEPLIEPSTIQKVIDFHLLNPEVPVINTVTPITSEEDVLCNTVVKVVTNRQGDGLYLSRSPIPYPKKNNRVEYVKHLGLYGLTREALLFFSKTERGKLEIIEDIEMLRFLENHINIKFIEVKSDTIAVDVPEDVQKVVAEMKRREKS